MSLSVKLYGCLFWFATIELLTRSQTVSRKLEKSVYQCGVTWICTSHKEDYFCMLLNSTLTWVLETSTLKCFQSFSELDLLLCSATLVLTENTFCCWDSNPVDCNDICTVLLDYCSAIFQLLNVYLFAWRRLLNYYESVPVVDVVKLFGGKFW